MLVINCNDLDARFLHYQFIKDLLFYCSCYRVTQVYSSNHNWEVGCGARAQEVRSDGGQCFRDLRFQALQVLYLLQRLIFLNLAGYLDHDQLDQPTVHNVGTGSRPDSLPQVEQVQFFQPTQHYLLDELVLLHLAALKIVVLRMHLGRL